MNVPSTALVTVAPAPMTKPDEMLGLLTPLKSVLAKDLTDDELRLFAMVAARSGLDPFAKQIYAVKRKSRRRGDSLSFQTGIDGYRSTAERTSQYAGSEPAIYGPECDCGEAPAGHPQMARVVVHRIRPDGIRIDQVGEAWWHEFYPGGSKRGDDQDGEDESNGFMWRKMPRNQLAKCAEAQGLRKAFPWVLADVYVAEEMHRALAEDAAEAKADRIAALPTAADRLAVRRAELEAQTQSATPSPAPAADANPSGEGERVTAPPSAAGDLSPEQQAVQGEVIGDTSTGLTWQQFRARMARANSTTGKVASAAAELWPERGLSRLPSEWQLDPAEWAALAGHMHI